MRYADNIRAALYALANRGYHTNPRRWALSETRYETIARLRRARRWNKKISRIRAYSERADLGPLASRGLY